MSTVSWSRSQEKRISGIGARYMEYMDLAMRHWGERPALGKIYLPTSLVHKEKQPVTPHTMAFTGGWLNIGCIVVIASMTSL